MKNGGAFVERRVRELRRRSAVNVLATLGAVARGTARHGHC